MKHTDSVTQKLLRQIVKPAAGNVTGNHIVEASCYNQIDLGPGRVSEPVLDRTGKLLDMDPKMWDTRMSGRVVHEMYNVGISPKKRHPPL